MVEDVKEIKGEGDGLVSRFLKREKQERKKGT